MSNTAFARRLLSLRVLALSCAAALAGCSLLPGQEGGASEEPPPAATAPGQASPEASAEQAQAPAHTDTPAGPPAPDSAPGWDLHTLESTALVGTPEGLTLESAWQRAMAHDAEYHAALSGRAAARTEGRLGRAAILPQVQASYSRNKITGLQRNFTQLGVREGDLDYDSTSAYIQLQQPLFNMDRYATFLRGKERVRLGEAEFALQEYEAALRLTAAYLETVAAEGRARLAQALADSLEGQARTQEALFKENEASIVDAQETRARLALARSEVIRARDARDVALRELAAMTGGADGPLANLRAQAAPPVLYPASLDEWRARVSQANPDVQMARESVRVAEAELQRATGRYLPTLDLVVGYSKADSENLSSLSQRTNTWSAGLHASIPLFSGGYDTANRARASAELEQAREELRAAQEAADAEAVRQYTAVVGGADRIRALRAAVESSEQSLEAAQASYQYGVRSNVDVLRSQDRLYEARLALADARLSALEALTALWAAAGELNENRFQEVTSSHLD